MATRAALALAAVAVVAGVRAGTADRLPLLLVPQGVSAYTVQGERVFLLREGTQPPTGFAARSPEGTRLTWCPIDAAFVSEQSKELFDGQGRYVAGPASRDMDRVAVVVDAEQLVRIDPGKVTRAAGRGDGQVSGEAFQKYQSWVNDPAKPVAFCQNPVR